MRACLCVLCVLLVATVAVAGDVPKFPEFRDLNVIGSDSDNTPPRFAFTKDAAFSEPEKREDAVLGLADQYPVSSTVVNALASDRKSLWLSADLSQLQFGVGCGREPCPSLPPPPIEHHAVVLYDLNKGHWTAIAWHIARVVNGKAQAAALRKHVVPDALVRKIDGADDAVALFEKTIGDPKAFAKTVSDRKDAVLYGSEVDERVDGGAKVRDQLLAWNLVLKVRDGLCAGVTASRTVAWIAANVDAMSAKKPKDKQPYRLFAIYEKTGKEWSLVNASFSVVTHDE